MSAPESYQLESLASEADAVKPPSPSASIDPSQVRWLENQRSRGWEVCKIVSRAISTVSCAATLIICMSWYSWGPNVGKNIWPGIGLSGALPSFFWDLAEFLTICARHGRGITPKALIGVELVLFFFCGFSTGWLGFQLGALDENVALFPTNTIVAECIFMGLSTLIHFILFIRACIERRREIRRRRPRVMYIPETGQTVYVVAKAFPKLPTWQSQHSARARSFPRSPQSPAGNKSPHQQQMPPHRVDVPQAQPYFQLDAPLPPLPPLLDRSPAPSTIKRKPVRGMPPNIPPGDRERHLRPSMRPPPDDYVPDEAELERMRRGDAQPQLILPGDVDLKFATSATGMTPADANSREGKFRVSKPMLTALMTGEPASQGAALRQGTGRTRSL